MEWIKCNNCKGTGLVAAEHGPKRWDKCPICKGKGKKPVKTNNLGGIGREHRSNK